MRASKWASWPAAKHWGRDANWRVPGTTLSVTDVCAIMGDKRSCDELFRQFPDLDPDDLREAIERGSQFQAQ